MENKENEPDLSEVVQSLKKCLSAVPALAHTWRFLAGVVYALNQYYQVTDQHLITKFADKKQYNQETDDVLSHILEKEHPNRNWIRGFYYNSGVMRLDACYERIFKAYLGSSPKDKEESKCPTCGKNKIDGPYLYKKIRHDFRSLFSEGQYEKSNFGKVRHEVNSLKHYVGGGDITEREQPELLRRALTELVAFLTDPKVTEKLVNEFPGQEPIAGRN